MAVLEETNNYQNVHLPRKKPLWDSECIEQSPRDVEETHEDQPTHCSLIDRLLPAILYGVVSSRGYARQAEHYKDKSPVWTVARGAKLVPKANNDC